MSAGKATIWIYISDLKTNQATSEPAGYPQLDASELAVVW